MEGKHLASEQALRLVHQLSEFFEGSPKFLAFLRVSPAVKRRINTETLTKENISLRMQPQFQRCSRLSSWQRDWLWAGRLYTGEGAATC